jgi:hypothetical protein
VSGEDARATAPNGGEIELHRTKSYSGTPRPMKFRRDAMKSRPVARSDRQIGDGLRSCTTPRGRLPTRRARLASNPVVTRMVT